MDLTTTFIALQTGWDMFLVLIFSIIVAMGIGLSVVFFQDKIIKKLWIKLLTQTYKQYNQQTQDKTMTTIINYNLKNDNGIRQVLVTHDGEYYVVSHSTLMSEPETLIFKSDSNGTITDWREVGGRKYADLDEVLMDMDIYLYSPEHLAFLRQV